MQLTETQLRKTIRSILNELLTRRKGKESWLKSTLGKSSGMSSTSGGGGYDDYDDYGDYGDYGDDGDGGMGEADESEIETDDVG